MLKKQIILENCEYYHQNILNEGGIFHIMNDIQSIQNSNTLNATYEYLDDIHNSNKDFKYIWISFDNFEKHPNSDEWVVCPWGGGQSSSNYETLDNNNPRPATIQDGDRIVKGYGGKFYMPRMQRYAQGDNIQMRKYFFTMDNGEKIPCYNLSLLGQNGGSTATMMAHFYKGKDINFKKGLYTIKAKGTAQNLVQYQRNMVELAKNTPELANFDADYIVFPQSSSSFNDSIARKMKMYLFRNAIVLKNGTVPKLKTWEMNFDTMVTLTIEELTQKKGMGRNTYQKYAAKNQEWADYLLYKTILYRAKETIKTYVFKTLQQEIKEFNGFLAGKDRRKAIWNVIVSAFNVEYERLSEALKRHQMEPVDHDEYMLTVFWDLLRGKHMYWERGYGKNNVRLENFFTNVENLKKAFIKGKMAFKEDVLIDNEKNLSIKEFDAIQRLSIAKQFELKPQIGKDGKQQMTLPPEQAKVVIIDDNYATGASLRNTAQLFIDNGYLAKNIITLTPGDMGEASTGGKQGADIPHQNAEGDLIHKIRTKRIGGEVDGETQKMIDAQYDKIKDKEAHQYRDIMHDQFYQAKQPQQYLKAESRHLTDKDINYIINEAIKRLK